jgi:hypothetical protein
MDLCAPGYARLADRGLIAPSLVKAIFPALFPHVGKRKIRRPIPIGADRPMPSLTDRGCRKQKGSAFPENRFRLSLHTSKAPIELPAENYLLSK